MMDVDGGPPPSRQDNVQAVKMMDSASPVPAREPESIDIDETTYGSAPVSPAMVMLHQHAEQNSGAADVEAKALSESPTLTTEAPVDTVPVDKHAEDVGLVNGNGNGNGDGDGSINTDALQQEHGGALLFKLSTKFLPKRNGVESDAPGSSSNKRKSSNSSSAKPLSKNSRKMSSPRASVKSRGPRLKPQILYTPYTPNEEDCPGYQSSLYPLGRVRNTIKEDDLGLSSSLEAQHLLAHAAEKFVYKFATDAFNRTTYGCKNVDYDPASTVVESKPEYHFLKDLIPQTVQYASIDKEAAEKFENSQKATPKPRSKPKAKKPKTEEYTEPGTSDVMSNEIMDTKRKEQVESSSTVPPLELLDEDADESVAQILESNGSLSKGDKSSDSY